MRVPERILIVGLGAIGRRHLANVRSMAPGAQVIIWHQHRTAPAIAEATAGVIEVFSVEEALSARPSCALVCGPAPTHVPTAQMLAEHGVHLLIEKPLSHTVEGISALLNTCRRNEVALLVGYNFRFYRPLQALWSAIHDGRIGRVLAIRAEVGQYLPDWRPQADYRTTVSARAELGGGALLELSHELDYLRWLGGEVVSVFARTQHVSDLDIDVEDVAELTVEFANGALGQIHLDLVQRVPSRWCRVIGSAGTLAWDGIAHVAQCATPRLGHVTWETLVAQEPAEYEEMYRAELRHFFDCVAGDAVPAVTGEDGYRAVALVSAARESAAAGRTVRL